MDEWRIPPRRAETAFPDPEPPYESNSPEALPFHQPIPARARGSPLTKHFSPCGMEFTYPGNLARHMTRCGNNDNGECIGD